MHEKEYCIDFSGLVISRKEDIICCMNVYVYVYILILYICAVRNNYNFPITIN